MKVIALHVKLGVQSESAPEFMPDFVFSSKQQSSLFLLFELMKSIKGNLWIVVLK